LSWWHFVIIVFSRVILNMSYRILYPFLPVFAHSLGVSFERAALFATVRSFMGLVSPFFGGILDRKGHRKGLFLGMVLLSAGACLIFAWPAFYSVLAAFAVLGLAKAIYDPSVQAYVSSFSSYRYRAKAIGFTELSWATSWFLGMPLCAFLIQKWSWHAPFIFMASAGLVSLALTLSLPPYPSTLPAPDDIKSDPEHHSQTKLPTRIYFILAMSFFMLFSNENLIVVYGAWMQESFGVKLMSLGAISFIIGFGELSGEITVTAWGDRVGKRRLLTIGLTGLAFSYLGVAIFSDNLMAATLCLLVLFYFSELAIVSSFPFVSEILPEARAKILSANYACAIAGRMTGSITGPWIWHIWKSITASAVVSFAGTFLALYFLLCYSKMPLKRAKKMNRY